MPTVTIERLDPSPTARGARASDLARARAADRLAGRTVWCATALPGGRGAAHSLHGCLTADGCVVCRQLELTSDEPFRVLAGRLDQALRPAGAVSSPAGVAAPGPLGRREQEMYTEAVRDGDALAADAFAPGDVVVLHDALTAALGEAVRACGAHAVWDVNAGAAPGRVAAGAAWEFMGRHTGAIDAFVMSWIEPGERAAGVEHIAAAMPSAGVVCTKQIAGTGAEAESRHNRGWSALLADIVGRDRDENVGGTLHARAAVAAR